MCKEEKVGFDCAAALGLAQLHRTAYQVRIEQTSKAIYGSLTFFGLAVAARYQFASSHGVAHITGFTVLLTAVFAMLEVRTSGQSNDENMRFVHEAEKLIAANCCPGMEAILPTKRPRKQIWEAQMCAISLGMVISIIAICVG